jgi:hypothetical protein
VPIGVSINATEGDIRVKISSTLSKEGVGVALAVGWGVGVGVTVGVAGVVVGVGVTNVKTGVGVGVVSRTIGLPLHPTRIRMNNTGEASLLEVNFFIKIIQLSLYDELWADFCQEERILGEDESGVKLWIAMTG